MNGQPHAKVAKGAKVSFYTLRASRSLREKFFGPRSAAALGFRWDCVGFHSGWVLLKAVSPAAAAFATAVQDRRGRSLTFRVENTTLYGHKRMPQASRAMRIPCQLGAGFDWF